ncbi:MAG: 50S ribosomal protein L23 [Saprospiraceae bacterium]|nr:50S ribosomal protein L23 [Saprospiraceae bacterium]
MAKNILIRPVITEKSDKQMAKTVYTFVVNRKANKLEVAKAVEAMFNVSVESVNTAVIPGKMKARSTRSGMVKGMKPAYKKAFVLLQEGETIDIFGDAGTEE